MSLAEVDVRVEGASLPALLQPADPARCCYADGWPHVSDTSHTQQTAHVRLLKTVAPNAAMVKLALFTIDSDFNAVARREARGSRLGSLPSLDLA